MLKHLDQIWETETNTVNNILYLMTFKVKFILMCEAEKTLQQLLFIDLAA